MKLVNPGKLAFLGLLSIGLGGCASVAPVPTTPINEVARQQTTFNRCYTVAAEKSQQAVTGNSPALYHTAANTIRKCVAAVAATPELLHSAQVMHASAVSIINFVKAGELGVASREAQAFRRSYPDTDLYMADGSSFIDNITVLLSEGPAGAAERGSFVNASQELKSEIRRVEYWQSH